MKIAIDISQIIYGTGVSVYTRNLVENLVKLYPQTDFVLYGGSLRRKSELDNFIKRLKVKGKTNHLSPKFLDLIWNSFHILPVETLIGRVDLVHTSDWAEPPSTLAKVTTVHDLIPFKYPQTTTTGIRAAHKKRLSWVKKESSAILAVSQSTKRDLVDLLKIDPEKIFVTYEGVEPYFQPQPPDVVTRVKKKYHLEGEYIFSLGTLEPRKNLPRLIEAFRAVKQRYPQVKLFIGGGLGWGEKLKPESGVILPGFIPYADLPGLYSGCLAFCLPSLYEGFGLPLLEAMACGAPVIASNVSSLPEVTGQAGILVNPEDPSEIATGILTALEQYAELSQKSQERAKIFSWEETARLTYTVYQKVLNQ